MEGGALRAEVGGHVVELVDNRPVAPGSRSRSMMPASPAASRSVSMLSWHQRR